MPHVAFPDSELVCPWSGCLCRIERIDFELEKLGDRAFYARVMKDWGIKEGFGLVGRCPDCRNYVLFTWDHKTTIESSAIRDLPMLSDDWHLNAFIQ